MEFEDLKNKHFFVFDSDNLDKVKSKLYGFAIINNKIFFEKIQNYNLLDGTGSYVNIQVNPLKNTIRIDQDINGNYGIYIFQNENYFAISNSFICLVEYIKDKFEITLNYDYAKSYISSELCSYIYEDTLVNEIKILPRNTIIHINQLTKTIDFSEKNYEEHSIELNSYEGIRILDKWFYKWSNILRNLKNKNKLISLELTGGLDSRSVLSLINASKINMNEIYINSIDSEFYEEDFSIASDIAKKLGFELNKEITIPYKSFKSLKTVLDISSYSKLGFSKGLWPVYEYPTETIYNLVGYGGECIRGYGGVDTEKSINFKIGLAQKYSDDWKDSTEKYVLENYKKLGKKFWNDTISLSQRHYKENRSRYHYGKSVIERYLINQINLTPLLDPLLYKLKYTDNYCSDVYLLMALIYERYCPELLDFKIEGDRTIDQKTITYAKMINKKYPFNNKFKRTKRTNNVSKISENDIFKEKSSTRYFNNDLKKFLENVFRTNSFKNNFKKYFPEEIYEKILLDFKKEYVGAMCDVFAVIGVLKIIDNVEYSQHSTHNDFYDWLESFIKIPEYSDKKVFNFNNLKFHLPPGFIINSDKTISNGSTTLFFENYPENSNISNIVEGYKLYLQEEQGVPIFKEIKINDIVLYEIRNKCSNTIRYWFNINNEVYQIYTYYGREDLEYMIAYLILSIG